MKTLLSICIALCVASLAFADPVTIWISSYQDKQYYENMVKAYKQVDTHFDADIHAFGFMEMGDKLTVAMKTGVGTPDV
ncbi:MAG: hypothetical protein OSB41_05790, partial [Kiritimatiellae bacterium]|nr:hypothetical protein [Kiritimatiellia bacterium]